MYFAQFRHNGKLIWRGLSTDVLSTAAQRLPDTIKEVKERQSKICEALLLFAWQARCLRYSAKCGLIGG
jgi:hypothetical protein